MRKIVIKTLLLMLTLTVSVSAQIADKPEFGKFALTGATIHTVTGDVIESGIILVNGNYIEFVGHNARITPDYIQLDYTGKHIYPGLIDAGTSLGLVEISAVPVTVDNRELGNFNPHMRAFTAINPNGVAIPVTRVEGVTTVVSNPASGLISGKSTLINLYGYSPDSMAVKEDAALYMEWPAGGRRGWWDSREDSEIEEERKKALKELNDFWASAKFYNDMMEAYAASPSGKTRPANDPIMNGMRAVVKGDLPVIIRVDRENDILAAIEWTKANPHITFILSSVAEGWRVADQIAESGLACLVGPILRTPARDHENYQRPYQNAGILHKAGVKVAIQTQDTENVRNLPFHAGYAATYGLGKEEALRAVTINTAEIFGVADKIGSIEVGKLANLVVSNGDIFETMEPVVQVFIAGYKLPMVSRHTLLYDEFLKRDVR